MWAGARERPAPPTAMPARWRPVFAFFELVVGFAVLFGAVHGPSTWWMVFGVFCLGTGYIDMTRISVIGYSTRIAP
jgi:hypothetical protein